MTHVIEKSPRPRVILCVDDDPTALFIRRSILEHEGYEVLTAGDAETALSLFKSTAVDLVITDQVMPGFSGVQLVQELKTCRKSVPIAILTGLSQPPEGSDVAEGFIVKGASVPDFLRTVSELLEAASLRQTGS